MPINVKTPQSYFFTNYLGFTQDPSQAFGPVPNALERKFNLTSSFKKAATTQELKAFAVTDGILFIVPQKDNMDLVNIILKPSKTVDIGVKIKYYVYRSIKRAQLFVANGTSFTLLPKDTSDIIPFLNGIWTEFLEYNSLSSASFDADKIGFSKDQLKDYKAFFTKDKYTLPRVKMGDHIGNFDTDFGFEVIIDEGDFAQDNSDTAFEFKDDFFRAKKCVLNLDRSNATNEYGNLPASQNNKLEKIFRENIYNFLDPAAYYGCHVTALNESPTPTTVENKNKGSISATATAPGSAGTEIKGTFTSPEDIYLKIVSKFHNKNTRYLYIKHKRNRSYNFYDNHATPITISGNADKFEFNKWPIKIFNNDSSSILNVKFNIFSDNPLLFSNIGISSKQFYDKRDLLTKITISTPVASFREVTFTFPYNKVGSKISSAIYLTYSDDVSNLYNNLFGNINLSALLEKEDFTEKQNSFVNHLRPILIQEGQDVGLYNTKLILEGDYIANTIPPTPTPSDNDLASNLRTYILFPQQSSIENRTFDTTRLTAGYYSANNSKDYITSIYGGGEIWKGIINDNSQPINSLRYRKENNDEALSIYQLGISQKEYNQLKQKVLAIDPKATNLFFHLEPLTSSTSSSFIKFKLKIQFDKEDGTLGLSSDPAGSTPENYVNLYTIDGCFFFTEDYSKHFKNFQEFAETTVEFRPKQDWNSEFGMDWYRKGQNTWPSDPDVTQIYDAGFLNNVGTIPNQKDGNSFNGTFVQDNNMLSLLKTKEYDFYPTAWTLADNETECFSSWLSLDKGETAKLNLRIRVKKEATNLRIRYPNAYFKISAADYVDPADAKFNFYDFPSDQKKVTSSARFFDLNIQCIKEFSFTQTLEVKADDKLAGILKAFPNQDKPVQNILFIPLRIKMPDNKERNYYQLTVPAEPGGSPNNNTDPKPVTKDFLSEQKKYLEQFLLHSQIKGNIETFKKYEEPLQPNEIQEYQWDLRTDPNFNKAFNAATGEGMYNFFDGADYFIRAYYEDDQTPPYANHAPTGYKPLKKYLLDNLPSKYKTDAYKNHLIVFFINCKGTSMHTNTMDATGINGFSDGTGTHLLVFQLTDDNNETVSHEVYHSLGIPHTFNKLDPNSIYVYKGKMTDNLLDYTHLVKHTLGSPQKPYDRRSLYHWQWGVAREAVNAKIIKK